MLQPGAHTLSEILSQPTVWAKTLDTFRSQTDELVGFWQAQPSSAVLFTGCGSTYYLSQVAATLFQSLTGIAARSLPGSELALLPDLHYPRGRRLALVAISRSGETTETLEAVRVFRERSGGRVLAITCDPGSRLAHNADFILAASAAQEESLAQTRSFSSMALLSQALAGQLAGHDAAQALAPLPAIAERTLDEYQSLAQQIGADRTLERFFFLGNGLLYGIACEAMLKMKEMALNYSEAYHTLEFRHGPMSMVDGKSLVVGLISPEIQRQEWAVLQDMQWLGGRTLALATSVQPGLEGALVLIDSQLPTWARPVAYLPVLQLLAYYRAISNGLDPDRPTNLSKVIQLEGRW